MKNKLWLLILLLLLTGCGKNDTTGYIGVKKNNDNGNMYLDINVNLFNDLFDYGDSLTIELPNGTEINDIPYYSNYNTMFNTLLFIQNGNNIELVNYGRNNTWKSYNFKTTSLVEVKLDVKNKYLKQEETFKLEISNDRMLYKDDYSYANYRCLTGGKLRDNFIYRSSTPIDNNFKRVETINKLMNDSKIQSIINLNNTSEELNTLKQNSSVYSNKKIMLAELDNYYQTEEYAAKVSKIMNFIIKNKGPFLIHSYDGVNRTGFVCLLLEALAGASYDEMLNDYMESYKNYYNITQESEFEKYYIIVQTRFDDFLYYLSGSKIQKEIKEADFKPLAMQYLKLGGMKYVDINKVIDKITK